MHRPSVMLMELYVWGDVEIVSSLVATDQRSIYVSQVLRVTQT
jgi:hypothetical protein